MPTRKKLEDRARRLEQAIGIRKILAVTKTGLPVTIIPGSREEQLLESLLETTDEALERASRRLIERRSVQRSSNPVWRRRYLRQVASIDRSWVEYVRAFLPEVYELLIRNLDRLEETLREHGIRPRPSKHKEDT